MRVSMSITVTFNGDTDRPVHKDLAEHICRLVDGALKEAREKHGVSHTETHPVQYRRQVRTLYGSDEYWTTEGEVLYNTGVHLPDVPTVKDTA